MPEPRQLDDEWNFSALVESLRGKEFQQLIERHCVSLSLDELRDATYGAMCAFSDRQTVVVGLLFEKWDKAIEAGEIWNDDASDVLKRLVGDVRRVFKAARLPLTEEAELWCFQAFVTWRAAQASEALHTTSSRPTSSLVINPPKASGEWKPQVINFMRWAACLPGALVAGIASGAVWRLMNYWMISSENLLEVIYLEVTSNGLAAAVAVGVGAKIAPRREAGALAVLVTTSFACGATAVLASIQGRWMAVLSVVAAVAGAVAGWQHHRETDISSRANR